MAVNPSQLSSTTVGAMNISAIVFTIGPPSGFQQSDAGEYVCRAENIAGTDTESVHLITTGEELPGDATSYHASSILLLQVFPQLL